MPQAQRCRTCGREYHPKDGCEWLQAVPTQGQGQALRDNVEWWCSRECRDEDPRHQPLADGEAMLRMINRLKAGTDIIPGDLGSFLAQASGQNRDVIVRATSRVVRQLQHSKQKR